MSPIVDIQRRLTEMGRIRTGDQVEFRDSQGRTKRRPRKLATFRLTSQRRELVEEAARLYGGEYRPWDDQWEVTVTAETIPIMLPPGEALSQWYELWKAGGCARRCDGVREVLTDSPCLCPADKAERAKAAGAGLACKPTTRVNVILPELPGLGVWRLESHGFFAAVELAGAAEYLSMATSVGHRVPAHLRLVQRSVKRQTIGPDGTPKTETRNFAVPAIDIDVRPADLLTGGTPVAQIAAPLERALPAGRPVNRRERVARPALPPGPLLEAEPPFVRPVDPPIPPMADEDLEGDAEFVASDDELVGGEPEPGLSMAAFAALAGQERIGSARLAATIGKVLRVTPPAPAQAAVACEALTDQERGQVADALHITWREGSVA